MVVVEFLKKLDCLCKLGLNQRLSDISDINAMIASLDTLEAIDFARGVADMKEADIAFVCEHLAFDRLDNLMLLRYVESCNIEMLQAYDGLLSQCRGIVVDISKFIIAGRPFDKMFALGQVESTSLDSIYKRLKDSMGYDLMEKLDGDMFQAFRYKSELYLASDREIYKGARYHYAITSLKESGLSYIDMISQRPGYTFIFESMTMENDFVLLACRSNSTGQYMGYSFLVDLADYYGGISVSKRYALTYEEALIDLTQHPYREYILKCDNFYARLVRKKSYSDEIVKAMALNDMQSFYDLKLPVADDLIDKSIMTVTAYKKRATRYISVMSKRILQSVDTEHGVDYFIKYLPDMYREVISTICSANQDKGSLPKVNVLYEGNVDGEGEYLGYDELEKRFKLLEVFAC